MGSQALILFAHPALHRSRMNASMAEAVRGMAGVTFHDLYEEYPQFNIDVPREQALLREHDVIVWQHPLHWYSAPALLKEWFDVVLELGFAYGEGGTALNGKRVLSAITTGGPRESYRTGGANRFTMRELLVPFEQTAWLCGMEYLEPFLIQGVRQLNPMEVRDRARHFREHLAGLLRESPAS